jgi:hypothetical protein
MAKIKKFQNGYAQVPNSLLQDGNLSFKARGLWSYMQSLPEDWDFAIERIADTGKDGKTSVQTGIKELEDAGYLERKQIPVVTGGTTMEYHLQLPTRETENRPLGNQPLDIEITNKQETKKLQGASRPVVAKKKLECWEEKEQIPGWDTLNSIYQAAFIVWYGLGWKFPKRDDLEDYKKRIKTSLIKSGLADTTSQGTVAPHATLIEVELMRFRDHWRDKKIQLPLKAWETWTNNMASFREKRR